jgi:hypothetical protein
MNPGGQEKNESGRIIGLDEIRRAVMDLNFMG